jgi:DNA-binding LacI/PurR family transcriptional regulator
LTTVGFDTAAIGRTGANLLIRWIESGERSSSPCVILPEQLIVRGSTARPRTTVVEQASPSS